ncbi:MAG: gfo/Idh/MocA family oxidoreductase [Ignavibacteriae bacterium]|nr:MAG: gfo/Idh/MocA family oxidoreductase [Ignavibacteriota bacterium]
MINGAIIGTGKIAVTGHMPAYLSTNIQDKVKIAACADTHKESRNNFTKQFPDIPVYTSLDEVLRNHTLDFADICVPPIYHTDYIEKSAAYNLNILCEKPFTSSSEDAEDLKELLLKTGKAFVPCHQYRYSPVWRKFKEMINENTGKWILQFNICRLQADSGFNPDNPSWRTDRSISGGGILADTGVHYIYLTTWMLGKPLSVTARTYAIKSKSYSVEDTAIVNIECENGISQINLTWSADKRANSALLVNESASLYYNGKTLEKNCKGKSEKIYVPDASDKTTYITQYVRLIEDFVACIQENQNCEAWINEACNSVKILNTAYESADSNRTLRLY